MTDSIKRNITFRGGRLPNSGKPRIRLNAALTPVGTAEYAPPDAVDNYSAVPADTWGMDGNDQLGDCTCAEIDHAVKTMNVYARNDEVISTDDQIVALYEHAAGYDPADPSTDRGAQMQDVRNYWRTNGVRLGSTSDRILLFAEVDYGNLNLVKWALSVFGEIGVGILFPAFAMDQFNSGEPWDVSQTNAHIEGRHAVALVGYDATYLYVVTWGAVQKMTYAFWERYAEETWVQLSQDLINAHTGQTVTHLSLYDLGRQFSQLTGQANPVPPPTPAPKPDPMPSPMPDALADFPRDEVRAWLQHTHHEHTEKEAAAADAIRSWAMKHGLDLS